MDTVKKIWNSLVKSPFDRTLNGQMVIVDAYPPNIEKIRKVFNIGNQAVAFAYGNVIYNPKGVQLSRDLIVHETTHSIQQGGKIEKWWDRYLSDKEFRIMQELEAYTYQYKAFCEDHADRNLRSKFLHRIVSDVSGPLYGNMINYKDAQEVILKCQPK